MKRNTNVSFSHYHFTIEEGTPSEEFCLVYLNSGVVIIEHIIVNIMTAVKSTWTFWGSKVNQVIYIETKLTITKAN